MHCEYCLSAIYFVVLRCYWHWCVPAARPAEDCRLTRCRKAIKMRRPPRAFVLDYLTDGSPTPIAAVAYRPALVEPWSSPFFTVGRLLQDFFIVLFSCKDLRASYGVALRTLIGRKRVTPSTAPGARLTDIVARDV